MFNLNVPATGGFLNSPAPRRQLISLTPLIDVVFILLIFFMLASSFLDLRTLEINAPKPGNSSTNTNSPILIDLKNDGLWMNSIKWDEKSLIVEIRKQKESNATDLVLIRPEKGISVQRVVTLLDKLSASKILKVQLIEAQQ